MADYQVVPRESRTPQALWPTWPEYALRLITYSSGLGDLREGYFVRVPANLGDGQHYLKVEPGEAFTAHPRGHDTGYTWEQLTAYAKGVQVSSPETANDSPQPKKAAAQIPAEPALPVGQMGGIFPSVESVTTPIPAEAQYPNLYAR